MVEPLPRLGPPAIVANSSEAPVALGPSGGHGTITPDGG